MPLKTCITPTIEMIRTHQIGEGQNYEFKGRLDLSDRKVKSDFINDVVAFLNAGPGHLIVGVHEKKRVFERFEPILGDPDAICRQFTSTLQDNIDPKPLGVVVCPLDLDDGFIVNVRIPEHRRRPYQNRINGAFYLRTGAQNTPIPRDQVHAMFTTEEKFEADVENLMKREDLAVEERDIMQVNGVTLHIAIVPFEHYDRGREPLDPGRGQPKTFRSYFGHESPVFKGCDGGLEARDTTLVEGRSLSRLFIGDDWLIHAYIAHPFVVDNSGRVTIQEFKDKLAAYLSDLAQFLHKEDIIGPFSVLLAVRNLQRNAKMARAFRNAKARAFPRFYRTERLDAPEMIDRFWNMVRDAAIYGRG
jgi:hypothetical protein